MASAAKAQLPHGRSPSTRYRARLGRSRTERSWRIRGQAARWCARARTPRCRRPSASARVPTILDDVKGRAHPVGYVCRPGPQDDAAAVGSATPVLGMERGDLGPRYATPPQARTSHRPRVSGGVGLCKSGPWNHREGSAQQRQAWSFLTTLAGRASPGPPNRSTQMEPMREDEGKSSPTRGVSGEHLRPGSR
jgi:hypothetical protein